MTAPTAPTASDASTGSVEYVVSRRRPGPAQAGSVPAVDPVVTAVLGGYEQVEVLHALGDSIVLARMPEAVRARILREHPELLIERNISYRHA